MTAQTPTDPKLQAALDELRELVLTRYPDATFTQADRGYAPSG
jgi:hypothetical protein